VGEDGEDGGDRRDRIARRSFAGDLRADHRFERAVFWRGVLITAFVAALVVLRELLL
jgi:hypothetical protein